MRSVFLDAQRTDMLIWDNSRFGRRVMLLMSTIALVTITFNFGIMYIHTLVQHRLTGKSTPIIQNNTLLMSKANATLYDTSGTRMQFHKLFISIDIQGRLGNNMYQYATLFAAAHFTNRTPLIGSGFQRFANIFQITLPISQSTTLGGFMKLYQNQTSIRTNFSEINIKGANKNVTMTGYFNSVQNFRLIRKQIRRELKFRQYVHNNATAFLDGFKHNGVKVGIHIRGTDMNNTIRRNLGYSSPPIKYFYKAMDYFRHRYENVLFIVCSDDDNWSRIHIQGYDVEYSTGHSAEVDMAILAYCRHVIVSQGTFSFWSGWLCNGTSVNYMNTYTNSKHIHEYHRTPQDEYNSWLGISV